MLTLVSYILIIPLPFDTLYTVDDFISTFPLEWFATEPKLVPSISIEPVLILSIPPATLIYYTY